MINGKKWMAHLSFLLRRNNSYFLVSTFLLFDSECYFLCPNYYVPVIYG